jgi:hypothetical protein
LFFDGDEEQPDFIGCRLSKEKKIVADLMNYAKVWSCPAPRLLDEDAVEECFHIDDDVPVTIQLTDSEICDMVMNEKTSSMPEPQPSTTSFSKYQDISGDIYSDYAM